jgi:hemolysin III
VKLMLFDRLKVLGMALYLVLGWVAIVALPQIVGGLDASGVALLVAGGLLYTVGAALFASKRPNPAPGVFGYHEVWHALVAAAGLCHYLVVLRVLGV